MIAAGRRTRTWTYPRAEFAKMFAPVEKTPPPVKLRALLKARFSARASEPEASFLLAVGAYDAMTAALLTDLGFEAVCAGAWQLAAAHAFSADCAGFPSHAMAGLVRELARGVEGARDRHFFETGEALGAPPLFAEAGAGGGAPARAFALARELIRSGAAGIHVDAGVDGLVAVKAAAQAMESDTVILARAKLVPAGPRARRRAFEQALERALEAASLGVDVICPEFHDTDLDVPRRFAEELHKRFPEQMLGIDLSPTLRWGDAKRDGRMPTNRALGEMGYALQFSSLLAFRTAGMALERWLTGFRRRGLDALADLQRVEQASLDGEPRTRMHQKFAGADRWRALERLASQPGR